LSHAGDDHLDNDNKGAHTVHKMSDSERMKDNETATAYANYKGRQPPHTYYCSGTDMILLQRKGRVLRHK
jgi:hypothetical protein